MIVLRNDIMLASKDKTRQESFFNNAGDVVRENVYE
jgi:hypothetical protein